MSTQNLVVYKYTQTRSKDRQQRSNNMQIKWSERDARHASALSSTNARKKKKKCEFIMHSLHQTPNIILNNNIIWVFLNFVFAHACVQCIQHHP